jgi:hypothetical protein
MAAIHTCGQKFDALIGRKKMATSSSLLQMALRIPSPGGEALLSWIQQPAMIPSEK